MPARWGFEHFTEAPAGARAEPFVENPNERVKWALRRLYYRQREHRREHGRYAADLSALHASNIEVEGLEFRPSMQATESRYEIRANGFDGAVVHLTEDGRVWMANRPVAAGYSIPVVDLSKDESGQGIVDKEPGQYLGHPTTVLLEDGKTMIAVYPKGHGRGQIVMKRSSDGGRTWSGRLPVPESWSTSKETPTIYRTVDARGVKRLILFSGLYPIRMSVSEDDGRHWSELAPIGDFGGIVAMSSLAPLRTGAGHYLAMFHDDGRFFTRDGKPGDTFTLYQTISTDGGLTWSTPRAIQSSADVHLCEPGILRSPDGKQLAVLLRENGGLRNSFMLFSNDVGKTWSAPRELPGALTGDRHTGKYAPDGRLFVSFRDTTRQSATYGDWAGWVGTYDDIVNGREGQYRVRLMDNHKDVDCAYPGVEVLADGTIVTTTYGHWIENEPPFIVSVRFTLDEIDSLARP
jgi:hypothetical protein